MVVWRKPCAHPFYDHVKLASRHLAMWRDKLALGQLALQGCDRKF